MTQLVVCLECARHVRVGEPTCPFCGGTSRGRARPPRRVAGLGRAAIMALGATVAGCGPGDAAPTTSPGPPPGAGEAVAPMAPMAPIEIVEPAEPTEPSEPSEPTEPSDMAEDTPPTEPERTPPPRTRAVPRDTIGAPIPAYGAAPPPIDVAPEPAEPRVRRGPPEDDHGGNVPLYGAPDSEE